QNVTDKFVRGDAHGVEGMKERTALLGGTFKIHSQEGKGTQIRVEIPIPRRPSAPSPTDARSLESDDVLVERSGTSSALAAEGSAKMLELTPEFHVVGQAAGARDAIDQIRQLQPEIVLMDIKMPGINGIEATRMIKHDWPEVEVIILSMYDEEEYVVEAVKAG